MRTVTLDILNEEAINLLKNLEALKLIRFRKDKEVTNQVKDQLSLSDFSFTKSRKALKTYKGSLSDATANDRRDDEI